jgi:hypothetical protein
MPATLGSARASFARAGQARTDFASIESDLDFLMRRVNHLPTASDLWRTALLIAFIGGVWGSLGSKKTSGLTFRHAASGRTSHREAYFERYPPEPPESGAAHGAP